jgi:hypothetical protein
MFIHSQHDLAAHPEISLATRDPSINQPTKASELRALAVQYFLFVQTSPGDCCLVRGFVVVCGEQVKSQIIVCFLPERDPPRPL